MNTSDTVKVLVSFQGKAIPGTEGYMAIRGEDVVAFYLDGRGDTGRIYPVSTCRNTFVDGEHRNVPSMWVDDGKDDSSFTVVTEIYFPEFPGWQVHSVSGGKTMSICLTKTD